MMINRLTNHTSIITVSTVCAVFILKAMYIFSMFVALGSEYFYFDSHSGIFADKRSDNMIASIEISLFLSYHLYNVSMSFGDSLQTIHLSFVISYGSVGLSL